MSYRFTIQPHKSYDKSFTIDGPENLRFSVDNDDVDSIVVGELAKFVVEELNQIPEETWEFVIGLARRASTEHYGSEE